LELGIREIQRQIPNSKFQILNFSASSGVTFSLCAAAVVATLGAVTLLAGPPKDAVIPMAVHITSPLGRSGLPGKVRIVARIAAPAESPAAPPRPVRFFVNDKLIGTDTDGPPYSTEWEDENPFEPCKLAVEVDDPIGGIVRDELDLAPIEIVEQSGITSVGLEATVQDAQGHYLGGLDASQFTVRENGEPQTIDVITSEAPAATFVLLVDSSQSMSRNIDFVRVAASRLVDHLRSDDSVVIAPFNKGITTVTGPSRDRTTIADAVAAIKPHGGTAIIDALLEATEQFPNADGRRVVVLLTDGYDENSTKSFEDTLARLKQTQVTVYTVAIGGVSGVSINGEKMLRRIAGDTGGRSFFPWNSDQLSAVHTSIADDVQHRYRMAYTPTNQRQDGTWRVITVTTNDPAHKIHARPGYQSMMPAPVRPSIEFIAVDAAQQYVDLTRDDFDVLEDGVKQNVDVFQEAVAPVTIALALDQSGSMKKAAPVVREAAGAFVDALRPTDPLGLVLFSDKAELVGEVGTDRKPAHDAVDRYEAKGGTALYDALDLALGRLKTVEGRRVIVVVTDGRDEDAKSKGPGSTATWDKVVASAKEIDATIYAIGLGARVDRSRLQQLANLTGGEAYFTTDVAALAQHYHRIVEELHRRYLVAYTSTNVKRDGMWRKVELRSHMTSVRVRSRGGYYAPPQ
jgi:Ca-activated chloride channel homolog